MEVAITQITGLQAIVSKYSRSGAAKTKYMYARQVLRLYNHIVCKLRNSSYAELPPLSEDEYDRSEKVLDQLEDILTGMGYVVNVELSSQDDELLYHYTISN